MIPQVGHGGAHLCGPRRRSRGEGVVQRLGVTKCVNSQTGARGPTEQKAGNVSGVKSRQQALQQTERLGRVRAVGYAPLVVRTPSDEVCGHAVGLRPGRG